jgi:type IV secretory pathway TraG/TraD family ATPase VirD4
MGHAAGIVAGTDVTLDLPDAAKNIAVFGETGTGKTTRVLNHLLVQALDLDCGALIFDVRGDFHETVSRAAKLTGKTVQRVGVGGDGVLGLNLLAGLTANTAAGFLEAAFRLLGQGQGDSGFWVSLAVTRCRHALSVLQHVPDAYRTQALATAQAALAELQLRASEEGSQEADLPARRLKASVEYELTVAPSYADKERSGLNRTIETALARFTDPELEDAFCAAGSAQADIADVLAGKVLVVNVPRERFKAAAAVVYLFVKERFSQALNARPSMEEDGPRKRRPVLFFCDEYQQLCSPGDAHFFDTSRALNVVGIGSSQSIEAYINALGDEYAAGALLANFANVIAFRSTERTMRYVAGKLGEVEVWREGYNAGKTDVGWFNATTNQGRSATLQRQMLLDPRR